MDGGGCVCMRLIVAYMRCCYYVGGGGGYLGVLRWVRCPYISWLYVWTGLSVYDINSQEPEVLIPSPHYELLSRA